MAKAVLSTDRVDPWVGSKIFDAYFLVHSVQCSNASCQCDAKAVTALCRAAVRVYHLESFTFLSSKHGLFAG